MATVFQVLDCWAWLGRIYLILCFGIQLFQTAGGGGPKNQPLRGRNLHGSWPCGSTIIVSRLRRARVHKLKFCVPQDTFCCGTVFVKVDMVAHVDPFRDNLLAWQQ